MDFDEDDSTDIDDIFPVKITSVSDVDTKFLYAWTEQSFDTTTGVFEDAPGGRTGDAVDGPFLVELNNLLLPDLPIYAWVRLRGVVDGDLYYEFISPEPTCSDWWYGWGGSGETGTGTSTATLDLGGILDQHDQEYVVTDIPFGTMMVAIVTVQMNGFTPVGPITPPAGWTVLKTDTFNGGENTYWIGYRARQAGDSSFSWTWGNSGEGTIRAMLCESVLGVAPRVADTPNEVTTGSGTTATVSVPGDLTSTHLLFFYVWTEANPGTFALPTSGTNLGNMEYVYADIKQDYTARGIATPDGPIFLTTTWQNSASFVGTCVAIPIDECLTPWLFVVDRSSTLAGYGITSPLNTGQGGSGLTSFTGIGAPSSTIGQAGSIYFDVTVPSAPLFYYRT